MEKPSHSKDNLVHEATISATDCPGTKYSTECEKVLIGYIVPGILKGMSHRQYKTYRVNYSNLLITPAAIYDRKVYNLHVDCVVTSHSADQSSSRENKAETRNYKNIWLASIPRMDDDGAFTINKSRHYVVSRQRLGSNIPMCEDSRKSKASLRCTVRSENYHTLESVEVCMSREATKQNKIVLSFEHGESAKQVDAIGYVRYLLEKSENSAQWAEIFLHTLRTLQCSRSVETMVMCLVPVAEETVLENVIFPAAINADSGECYTVPMGEYEVRADYILLCQLIIKFVRAELGEVDCNEDKGHFRNKVVDNYANIMGRFFRWTLSRLRDRIANMDPYTPRIHEELVLAIHTDKWGDTVQRYNDDLKIARRLESLSSFSAQAALQEVVTLVGSHTADTDIGNGYNSRMLHPSQEGYLCIVRAPDDADAGLRSYLASDCVISPHTFLYPDSTADHMDIRALLSVYLERISSEPDMILGSAEQVSRSARSGSAIFWSHNFAPILVGNLGIIIGILEELKLQNKYLSWSIHDGILESRSSYGRWMYRCVTKCYGECLIDSREVERVKDEIISKPSRFNSLFYQIPFVEYMPVARATLSTKIAQKTMPAVPEQNLAESVYLENSQMPLVRTSKGSREVCGTNVIVAYCTFQGGGVEDGIVVNRASVDRGLFGVNKKTTISWSRRTNSDITVVDYRLYVSRGEVIKGGTVLLQVEYKDRTGVIRVQNVTHQKPYNCEVKDVIFSHERDGTSPMVRLKDLINVDIVLVRFRRFQTGDKLSSRFGQKSVAVALVPQEDMPFVEDVDPRVGPNVDIIINPLSVYSRCTISQELSSAVGHISLEVSAIDVVNKPFGPTIMYYNTRDESTGKKVTQMQASEIDMKSVNMRKVTLVNGMTGEIRDAEIYLGVEYYMVLNHFADEKIRFKGYSRKDNLTGTNMLSGSDTCVKYNWQEFEALLHSKSYSLLSKIYNETGAAGFFAYCSECDRQVDGANMECEYCGSEISDKIELPRPLVVGKMVVQALGGDMVIRAKSSESE